MRRALALTLTLAACGDVAAPSAPAPDAAPPASVAADGWFRDVTSASGVAFVHVLADGAMDTLPESVGAGVTAFDYDGDGRLDLYFAAQGWHRGVSSGDEARGLTRDRLFRNLGGGRFEDATGRAGIGSEAWSSMAVAFDADDDGWTDLLVLRDGPNVLWRNRGDGTFEDATARAGLAGAECSVAGAAFDADGDGDLDVYVGNYVTFDASYRLYYKPDVFPGPLAFPAQADRLWINRGDGTFTDGTAGSGMDVTPGRAMGVTVFDQDSDGRPDVYVANDATANFLFRNLGGGKFRDVAVEAGAAFGVQGDAAASMAAMAGDVDGDGRTDLHVTDASYGSLLVATESGFADRIVRSGIAASSGQWASWGGGLADLDADGRLDLYVTNGDLHRATGRPDLLFRGNGDGTFEDVSADAGPWFREERCGRGAVLADLDDDGRLDAVVTHVQGAAVLLRNEMPQRGRSLLVALRAARRNASGQGARVTVTAGGRAFEQTAWPRCGYLTQGDPRLHFGLGGAARVERIDVVWPDGTRQTVADPPETPVVTVVQPGAER